MQVRAKITAKLENEFDVYELLRRDGDYKLGLVDPDDLEVELNQVLGIDLGDYGVSLHYDDGLDRFKPAWPGDMTDMFKNDYIKQREEGVLSATFKYESKEEIRKILPEKVVAALDALNEHDFTVEVDGR